MFRAGNNLAITILLTGLLSLSLVMLVTPYYWAAWVPPFALLMALLVARAPHWGFLAMVATIPFGAYRKVLGDRIDIAWLLAALLILILAVDLLLRRRPLSDARASFWPLMALFMAVNLIALAFSPYPDVAFKDTLLWFAGVVFIALPLFLLRPEELYRHLPNVLIISIGIGALLAVMGSFLGLEGLAAEKGDITRGLGGTRDPNNMGLMLLFGLPLLVHRLLYRPAWRDKLLYGSLIALTLLALAATYSRGAVLMLGVCTAQLVWHYRHRFKIRLLGLLIAIMALGVSATVMTLPQSFWERQLSITDSGDKSLSRRSSYLVVGWDSFKEAPLLGHGPGTFPERYVRSEEAKTFSRKGKSDRRFAHNSYVEVLVGSGLLGFMLFLAIQYRGYQDLRTSERLWQARQQWEQADLVASYRIMFITLLAYLTIFSDTHHKYWLLILPVAALLRRDAERSS
ncbi:O-antigen ligase family protein [Ferrimonas balearica]|uniref:O-antigen ligase family protein n=1 Tax=Ferrimonas balearica TaxID=44012 RepID=UPI001C99CDD3|nr:O-antigen ligase family protein [Ferrimonas balearica]MBY5923321.1 O-antigen ligase family protein [Ferrimonas balearica]MBY5995279.1 O-antigen ligase family protein [Ferrimonas balearica]